MTEDELIEMNRTYAEAIKDTIDRYDSNEITPETACLILLGNAAFLGAVIHNRMVKYFMDKEQNKEEEK